MTDSVLIGAADNYTWEMVRPWFNSARRVGFTGDIWLIVYRPVGDLIEQCEKRGIRVYHVNHDRFGQPLVHEISNSPTIAHNTRMFHAGELLARLRQEMNQTYEHIIMTDVSDVIFQLNPLDFVSNWDSTLICGGENILYADEPWGKDNMLRGYGEHHFNSIAHEAEILNVGTLAMASNPIKFEGLVKTIYAMTEGRYYPSDQSSFNYLVQTGFMEDYYVGDHLNDPWACQCGTVLDPSKSYLWKKNIDPCPLIDNDGYVHTANGEKLFYIVHQWNRVPELQQIIPKRYAD